MLSLLIDHVCSWNEFCALNLLALCVSGIGFLCESVNHVCSWNGVLALSLLTTCVHEMKSLLQACWLPVCKMESLCWAHCPCVFMELGLLFGNYPVTEGLASEKSGNSEESRSQPFLSHSKDQGLWMIWVEEEEQTVTGKVSWMWQQNKEGELRVTRSSQCYKQMHHMRKNGVRRRLKDWDVLQKV